MDRKKNKILKKIINKEIGKELIKEKTLDELIWELQETEMDFRDWLPELEGEKTVRFSLDEVLRAAQTERNKFRRILKQINQNYGRRKEDEEKLLEMDRVLERAKEFLAE